MLTGHGPRSRARNWLMSPQRGEASFSHRFGAIFGLGLCGGSVQWYSDRSGRRAPGYLRLFSGSLKDFEPKHDDNGRWTAHRHLEEHTAQTRLLLELAGRVDVVVTHWPPTMHAVAPWFMGDALNGYFANYNEELVQVPGVWL